MSVLTWLFLTDLAGTVGGIQLMRLRHLSRLLLPVTGRVMLGIALFWIVPDLVQSAGWAGTVGSSALLLATLIFVDRRWMPICPCCTHGSRQACGAAPLALLPLLVAILIHNAFDGWMAVMAVEAASRSQKGIAGGLLAHKIPEAIVFGMMLRAATRSKGRATAAAMVTSFGVLTGACGHLIVTSRSVPVVLTLSLALACASFLFVGSHLFLKQRKEQGTQPALLSSAAGLLVTVLVQQALFSR